MNESVTLKTQESTKLYPPLTTYYNRLAALLECDPEVKTELDYDGNLITVTVSNPVKAAAWREILPETKEIGCVKFSIDVICDKTGITENVVETALTGNEVFSRMYHLLKPEIGIDREFCYFKPTIVQFNNDNFGSPESLETWTAEDLAREVLDIPIASICTEPIEK